MPKNVALMLNCSKNPAELVEECARNAGIIPLDVSVTFVNQDITKIIKQSRLPTEKYVKVRKVVWS